MSYVGHIQTSSLQRTLLGVGSAFAAIYNPYRHDMVAVCGETTGLSALKYMQRKMQADQVGQSLLETRPRINSSTVDMDRLRKLGADTFGRQYVNMLDKYKITPDSRMQVRFVDDADLAYVMQRYRETHDFVHLLLDQPTNMFGEVVVKWFEAIQTRLPMCYLAALAGPVRLSEAKRKRLIQNQLPWAVKTACRASFFMNVDFENRFEDSIANIRKDMDIHLPKGDDR